MAKFSRPHYELISEAIRNVADKGIPGESDIEDIVEELVTALSRDNRAFEAYRFRLNCLGPHYAELMCSVDNTSNKHKIGKGG